MKFIKYLLIQLKIKTKISLHINMMRYVYEKYLCKDKKINEKIGITFPFFFLIEDRWILISASASHV